MSSDGAVAVVRSRLPSNGNGACHQLQARTPEYYASTDPSLVHAKSSNGAVSVVNSNGICHREAHKPVSALTPTAVMRANGAGHTLSSNGHTPEHCAATDPTAVMHVKSSDGAVAAVHLLPSNGTCHQQASTAEYAAATTAAVMHSESSNGAITLSSNGSVIPTALIPQRQQGQGTLKERLRNGEQLYGAFCVSFSPVVAEILGWAGYDFVVVDMEHGPGDVMAALPVLRALASTNTPAILRLPENDSTWAKKALDIGPAGIMFPKVDDAEAAVKAVRSCRYPPNGIRGAAYPLVRATRYGLDPTYLSRCEEDLLIMCQVESREAVANIAEIAAVDGVDCIQTGPRDLRSDMGLLRAPHDKRPTELLREVEKEVKASGVYLGGFSTSEDSPSKLLELGYNMVIGAYDVAIVRDSAVADIRRARSSQLLGSTPPRKCNDTVLKNSNGSGLRLTNGSGFR